MATRELKDSTSLASTTEYGVAKLAADGGTTAGTVVQATDTRLAAAADLAAHIADTSAAHAASAIAVTPTGGIAATTVQAALAELDTEKQAADADLTTIAGLAPSDDDVIQRKAGAWVNRTPTQLRVELLPITTKGDLIIGNASGAAIRKAVGTDDQMLIADSTEPDGIRWGAPPSVGAPNFDDLANVDFTGKANGHVPYWDSGTSSWKSQPPTGGSVALDDLTDATITSVADGDHLIYDSATANWVNKQAIIPLELIIGDRTNVISTGIVGDITIPYKAVIVGWRLLAKESGSIALDLWKCTYSQFDNATHPVVGDSIVASAHPLISAAHKGEVAPGGTLTGWTTAVAAGDIIRVNVDSVTTITACTFALILRRDA